MPEATFIQVPADQVRHTDDLLIDDETKEISENGTPHVMNEVHVGDQWVYLKLAEPIGRKKVWKVAYNQRVHIVRMQDTPEEKREQLNQQIAKQSLRDFRKYWMTRHEIAQAVLPGVKPARRSYWGDSTGFTATGNADQITRLAARMAEQEVSVGYWNRVERAAEKLGVDYVAALQDVLKGLEDNLLNGWGYGGEEKTMREWRREALSLLRMMERL